MSSLTRRDGAVALVQGIDVQETALSGSPQVLTARQRRLEWLWSFYRCRAYDGRATAWDGSRARDPVEHEVVAQTGSIPPNWNDLGGAMTEVPLQFRRPLVSTHLVRVIVNKFTGLLFSAARAPTVRVLDDPITQEWVNGMLADTRYWHRWKFARAFGGSMGAVGMGFRFVRGLPVLETHDPRWSYPTWADRDTGELASFEKKYAYSREEADPDNPGSTLVIWYWYRRVIDRSTDTVWQDVPAVAEGEPPWARIRPTSTRRHDYGFVPVVWVQNMESEEDVDGQTDVEGVHQNQQEMDRLMSQATHGTIKNCDPTPVVKTGGDEEEGQQPFNRGEPLRKGSDYGIELERGGDAKYLEMTGSGTESALKLVDKIRAQSLELARCVVDTNFDGPARTEKETETNYSSMIEAADELRVQYGDGAKRLIRMILDATRMKAARTELRGEEVVREVVELTPAVVREPGGAMSTVRREPGEGVVLELAWPPYRSYSLGDLEAAVEAVTKASVGGIIDRATGTRFVGPYMRMEDPEAVVRAADAERDETLKQERDELALRGKSVLGAG